MPLTPAALGIIAGQHDPGPDLEGERFLAREEARIELAFHLGLEGPAGRSQAFQTRLVDPPGGFIGGRQDNMGQRGFQTGAAGDAVIEVGGLVIIEIGVADGIENVDEILVRLAENLLQLDK